MHINRSMLPARPDVGPVTQPLCYFAVMITASNSHLNALPFPGYDNMASFILNSLPNNK